MKTGEEPRQRRKISLAIGKVHKEKETPELDTKPEIDDDLVAKMLRVENTGESIKMVDGTGVAAGVHQFQKPL